MLSLNAAIAAGKTRHSVALLETGPVCANAPLHNLNDLAWGYCSARDVLVPYEEHVDLILTGEPIGWSDEERMKRLLELAPILEEKDFIFIDAEPAILEGGLPLLPWASEVFVVVAPEQVAGGEALWFIQTLGSQDPGKQISLILNRARDLEIAETICSRLEHDFENILHVPLVCVGIVAEDPGLAETSCLEASLLPSRLPFAAKETVERLVRSAIRSHETRHVHAYLSDFLRNLLNCIHMAASRPGAAEAAIARDVDPEISEEAVAEFKDLILGALEARDQEALDFRSLYSLVRQRIASGKGTNQYPPYAW